MDLSTSVAAHGKVQVLQDGGLPVPQAWMRDGLLQPLGGAKGFALGLLVEALAGVVSGAGAVSATPGPDDQGVFLLAFDPGRFGPPADVAERLEAMLAYVLGVPLEPGAEPLRAPGATLPPLAARPGCALRARAAARRAARDAGRRARRRSGQELMKRLPGS